GISILENCAALGVPIPEKLKQALKQLNNKK
ncbi:phage holin family protein, partial [Clostridium sp.]